MGDPFLAIVGAFLIFSGFVLYLMRHVMARSGVDGWAWLPEGNRFKTYEQQLAWSKVAAGIVATSGGLPRLLLTRGLRPQ
ncbi:hypothetical protein [Paenarthrobacter ilicis]|uniref:hypothetical protein n=1 Tax=Paenarthrobacter ilicis TaxID=43665 RepID=UPI0028D62AD2|nr:hypothetical protein [Paenarthrobacter ilicis]